MVRHVLWLLVVRHDTRLTSDRFVGGPKEREREREPEKELIRKRYQGVARA